MTLTPVRGSRAGQCYRTLRPCEVTPEHGSAKKRAKKSVRKKILMAQDPGREVLETRMRELRALADANMKAQVQAWQTYAGKPDVAVTNGEESLRKKMLLSDPRHAWYYKLLRDMSQKLRNQPRNMVSLTYDIDWNTFNFLFAKRLPLSMWNRKPIGDWFPKIKTDEK